MQEKSFGTPGRILVRGVNWLGDAVMSTPALLRLKEKFPDSHVTLLTPAKLSDLWLQHPAVDSTLAPGPGENVFQVARRIRAERFDLAVLFPNSIRSGLEAWLGKVPKRIGYANPWRNALLTRVVARPQNFSPMRKRSAREVRRLIA